MRKVHTEAEKAALDSLNNALVAKGARPRYAVEITDSPDALFWVGDTIAAIECRYIAHPKLLENLGRRNFEPDVLREVVIPYEPHLWVKQAIEEKNKNVGKYLLNTGASEAWLLLHSSSIHHMIKSDEQEEEFRIILAYGATLTRHEFSRIWFADIYNGIRNAIEIYGPDTLVPWMKWEEFVAQTPRGYPRTHHWYGSATVRDDGNGGKEVAVNLNDPRIVHIGIQPLDERYTIDYGYLYDNDRNIDKTGYDYKFSDNRPKF